MVAIWDNYIRNKYSQLGLFGDSEIRKKQRNKEEREREREREVQEVLIKYSSFYFLARVFPVMWEV